MQSFNFFLFFLVPVLLIATFAWQRYRMNQIREEYANDPEVEVEPAFMVLRMRTRPPLRGATVVQAGGGKNNPQRWDLSSSVRLEPSGLTLSLSKEGVFGGLRELVGLKDIHVGDELFDKAFTVRGNDSESVVRLLSDENTRQAVHALFNLNLMSFKVDAGGGVQVRAYRRGVDGAAPKELLLRTLALLDRLEGNAGASSQFSGRSAFR